MFFFHSAKFFMKIHCFSHNLNLFICKYAKKNVSLHKIYNMRRILFCFLLILPSVLWGRTDSTKVYQGFSGGMMLHTGYLFGQNQNAPRDAQGVLCSPQGATFGIGGAIRVHLLNHLRIGGEGFVSTMPSTTTDIRQHLQKGSYVRSGWGGMLIDAYWRCNKILPYIGGTLGGGAMRSLFIIEGDENDWQEEQRAVFHRQPFFLVNPYVGFNWEMTKKVHLTFRFDWMLAIHKRQLALPTGPRIHVGFMFCH